MSPQSRSFLKLSYCVTTWQIRLVLISLLKTENASYCLLDCAWILQRRQTERLFSSCQRHLFRADQRSWFLSISQLAARDIVFFRTRYLSPRLKSIRHRFLHKREFWSTQIFRFTFSLHWRHARLHGNCDWFWLVLLTWIQLPTGLSKTTPHSPVIHPCLFYFLSSSNSKWYVLKNILPSHS